jgi:hypothetical protein
VDRLRYRNYTAAQPEPTVSLATLARDGHTRSADTTTVERDIKP